MKTICNRFEIFEYLPEIGRSGIPALAIDLKTKRTIFVKYPDYNEFSQSKFIQQMENIKNEIIAVTALQGFGSPKKISECIEWNRFSNFYEEILRETPYLITEKVDQADRIEEKYATLLELERIEILAQLFETLNKAHNNKFSHGDIDLKHLYWQRECGRLVIIDWGNSIHKLNDNAKEMSFDIAKSAEIVYSLLVLKPFPINQNENLFPLPDDAPDLLKKLCQWAPRQGWPSDFPQDFCARNMATIVRDWANLKYQQLGGVLSDWIPLWVKNPLGEEWKIELRKSFSIAPHRGLANIAISTLAGIKAYELIRSFESSYNKFCDTGDWRGARNIVHELLSRKFLNDNEGFWLSQILAYLQNQGTTSDGFGKNALKFLLSELLDDKGGVNNQYLNSLLEVTTRTLIHNLPNEIFQAWNENSLIKQIQVISTKVEGFNVEPILRNHEVHNTEKIQNELLSHSHLLCDAYECGDISKLLVAYINLNSILEIIGSWSSNRSFPEFDNLKERVDLIIKNLDEGITSLNLGNRLKAIELLKTVWILDRNCYLLFKQWFQVLESTSVDSSVLGTSISLSNKSSRILFESISNIIEQVQPIKIDNKISLEEKCRKLEEILFSVPENLPSQWQIEPAIIEWLALFDALICTMQTDIPLWVKESYEGNKTTPYLKQSRKLLVEIRSFNKNTIQPSENENLRERDGFNIPTYETRQETPFQPINDNPNVNVVFEKKVEKNPNIHARIDTKTKSLRLPIIIAALFFGMIALGILFSVLTSDKTKAPVSKPTINSSLEEVTKTTIPTIQSTPTVEPSQTLSPTFTATHLPSYTPTINPSPTVNTIISIPTPVIPSIQLMQFNSFSAISPNEPFSVFISPSISDGLAKKIKDRAGFFHDSNTGYWRFKSYPLSIINVYPEINPVKVNLGTLLFQERFNMANSLSVLGNSISLQPTDSSFGLYLIDSSGKNIEFLIKLEGTQLILQTKVDNEVKEKKVIMDRGLETNEIKIDYWMYIQINQSQAQIFLNVDKVDNLRTTSLTDLQFISSYPVERNLKELGLIAYGEADILIEKMILYGAQ